MGKEIKSGVFAEYAEKYFESGMNVLPVVGKQPVQGLKWQHWQTVRQTQQDIEVLVKRFGNSPGIGVIMGKVSGVVAFDFDYKWCEAIKDFGLDSNAFNEDQRKVMNLVDRVIKPYAVRKKGVHGFTAFFKWRDGMKPVTCDRHGTRLFDFKANGQVVVPPSWHSNDFAQEPIYYVYEMGDLVHDADELTELDFGKILDLKEQLTVLKPGSSVAKTRHATLLFAALDWFKLGASKKSVAERLVKLDFEKHSGDEKGVYLLSQHCISQSDALKSAQHWVERIWTFFVNKNGLEKNEKKSVTPSKEGWEYFIEMPFESVRRDLVSGAVKARKKKTAEWKDLIAWEPDLKIQARELGVPVSQVKERLDSFCLNHEGQDFLCDIPAWDGIPRVRAHCDRIHSTDFDKNEFFMIFKRWCVQMLRRAFDPMVQNECLIFKGKQGIGKDTWMDDLFNHFQPYYGTPMIGRDAKEFSDAVSRLLVAKIPEFERTETLSIAELKNVITTSSAFFRRPYAQSAEYHKISCSFIASSNSLDLLRDSTGNRRFVVVEIGELQKVQRVSKADSVQMLAEIYNWFLKKEDVRLSNELEFKILQKLNLIGPPDIEYEIACLLAKRLIERFGATDKIRVGDADATTIVLGVCREYNSKEISARKIQMIANHYFGGQGRVDGKMGKIYLKHRIAALLQGDSKYIDAPWSELN